MRGQKTVAGVLLSRVVQPHPENDRLTIEFYRAKVLYRGEWLNLAADTEREVLGWALAFDSPREAVVKRS